MSPWLYSIHSVLISACARPASTATSAANATAIARLTIIRTSPGCMAFFKALRSRRALSRSLYGDGGNKNRAQGAVEIKESDPIGLKLWPPSAVRSLSHRERVGVRGFALSIDRTASPAALRAATSPHGRGKERKRHESS